MKTIDFVDLAYRPTLSVEGWLRDLLCNLPWTSESAVVLAYELDLSDLQQPRVGRHVSLRGAYDEDEIVEGHRFLMGGKDIWRLYRRRLTSAHATFGAKHPVLKQFMKKHSVRDGGAIAALDARRVGVILAFQGDRIYRFSPKEKHIYSRVAAHVAAAARLREIHRTQPWPDSADAVLSPSGRFLHATGDVARSSATRDRLRSFAQHVERKRRARDHDPESALEAWTALCEGRWSLVEHLDTDGRRFCLFVRNDPHLDDVKPLTRIERQVAMLAALGMPNKLIAYELGTSEGSVAQGLRTAMRKLGVQRRADLISALGVLAETVFERLDPGPGTTREPVK